MYKMILIDDKDEKIEVYGIKNRPYVVRLKDDEGERVVEIKCEVLMDMDEKSLLEYYADEYTELLKRCEKLKKEIGNYEKELKKVKWQLSDTKKEQIKREELNQFIKAYQSSYCRTVSEFIEKFIKVSLDYEDLLVSYYDEDCEED